MEPKQAIEILTQVKANWTRQPVDAVIAAVWIDRLAKVSYSAALEAVVDIAESGRAEAPAPGEVYLQARGIDDRAEDDARRKRLRLEAPKPNEEERARTKAAIRELIEKLERKFDINQGEQS